MLYQCHYAKSYRILEGARIKSSEKDYSPEKYVQTSRPNSATVRVLEIIVEAYSLNDQKARVIVIQWG